VLYKLVTIREKHYSNKNMILIQVLTHPLQQYIDKTTKPQLHQKWQQKELITN